MLRYLVLAIIVYLLYRVLKGILGKTKETRRGPEGEVIDELVQDACCRIYIPRRDSVKRVIDGKEYFFCSDECAIKYESNKGE